MKKIMLTISVLGLGLFSACGWYDDDLLADNGDNYTPPAEGPLDWGSSYCMTDLNYVCDDSQKTVQIDQGDGMVASLCKNFSTSNVTRKPVVYQFCVAKDICSNGTIKYTVNMPEQADGSTISFGDNQFKSDGGTVKTPANRLNGSSTDVAYLYCDCGDMAWNGSQCVNIFDRKCGLLDE